MSNWQDRDGQYIWHPFTPLTQHEPPLFVKSARGVYLEMEDGRKIIDAISSWWVNLHGHAHPHIAEAVARQAAQLEHVIFAGFTHEPAIQLSENLMRILPENQNKIFFSDNGSTAVEVALKMAFQYWHNQGIKKKKVIALDGSYHGDTFGSMSASERGLFTAPFSDYLFDVQFIPFPGDDEQEALKYFQHLTNTGDVAAFIFEPLVQAAGGMRMYSAEILDKLIAYAHQQDVICIADEVFTGFSRTGKWFASDHLTHKPDIMALSKGLTGGTLPMGITTCSGKIAQAYHDADFSKTFFHGHSYTANPIACAAANASFELLMAPECKQSIDRISKKHQGFIGSIDSQKVVQNARSLGTIAALELNIGETSYTNAIRKTIYSYFLEHNILLRPLGNVIYILPPYCITNDELDLIYDHINNFLMTIQKSE